MAGRKEGDPPVERNRRNSDSVVYVRPKESEGAIVLPKLKQAEIEFQQEMSSQGKESVECPGKGFELKTESGTGYTIF